MQKRIFYSIIPLSRLYRFLDHTDASSVPLILFKFREKNGFIGRVYSKDSLNTIKIFYRDGGIPGGLNDRKIDKFEE